MTPRLDSTFKKGRGKYWPKGGYQVEKRHTAVGSTARKYFAAQGRIRCIGHKKGSTLIPALQREEGRAINEGDIPDLLVSGGTD